MGGSDFGYIDRWLGRLAFCQGQDVRVAETVNDLVRILYKLRPSGYSSYIDRCGSKLKMKFEKRRE
jgi:hypothetical protein